MEVGHSKCYSLNTFKHIGLFNGGMRIMKHTPPNLVADDTVIHILTDVLLALLPTLLIWRLHMVRRVRLSLIAVLSIGILAAIAGIIRQVSAGPLDEYDAYSIWNLVELHLGIVAASLPALKRIFIKVFETIGSAASAARTAKYDVSNSIVLPSYGNATAVRGAWKLEDTSQIDVLCARDNIRVTREVQVDQG